MTNVYLRRDIDYLFAPYSYDQLFLRMPYDYVAEVASDRLLPAANGEANSYWSQQYVPIDTTVEDLPNALRLGVRDPEVPRRWAAVIETKNPDWAWVITDRPEDYPRWLAGVAVSGCVPYRPDMTQLLIVDEPDERNIDDALSNRRGSKNIIIESYDLEAAIGKRPAVPEIRSSRYYSVGIGEGETRFQAFTEWPEEEEFHFAGLTKLKTQKGPLRKRFTTEDLADCARLFGLNPFDRDFYTGRATLINSGYPLPESYGPAKLFERPEHSWDTNHGGR